VSTAPAALGAGRLPRPAAVRRALASREPLLHNGHLLSVSSLLTSVLGAGYWTLATRLYNPATLGRNYSAISAMMLFAGIGQLNLTNVLVRFIPAAGARTRTLVARAYAAAIAAITLLATGFVLLTPDLAPQLGFLRHPVLALCFVAATAGYGLFIMQDGVLTGLRRPDWVVLENAVFAAIKIAALALPILVAAQAGILLSWVLALAVAIAVTNTFLFTRAIPRHIGAPPPENPAGRQPAPTPGYIVGDYIGSLFWFAAITLPPLIVLDTLGPAQAAYFSLTWVIAYMLYLVSSNMGSSLVVESATNPAQLTRNCRRVLTHTGILLTTAVLALTAAAPEILRVFGPDYASHGTALLRLLLISALPNLVVATAVSVCRARRRIRTAVAILAVLCCSALGLTVLLLPVIGIAGAGAAWLIAEIAVAAALLAFPHTWLGTERIPTTAIARAAVTRTATVLAKPADHRLTRSLARAAHPGQNPDIPWFTRRSTDILVLRAVADLDLVVKHPSSDHGRQTLARQAANLQTLAADERLGDWRRLLPGLVACDLHQRLPRTAEHYRPGTEASTLIQRDPETAHRIAAAALAAITELHHATGVIETPDPDRLHAWIDTPLETLRKLLTSAPRAEGALDALRARLYTQLADRPVLTAWTHGDYHPGNVLMTDDGTEVTAIIDWATAHPNGPAATDRHLFRLALQRETGGEELGALVVRALRQDPGRTDDALLLLTWLRHVADNLNQSDRYRRNRPWLAGNVAPVLREVAG
jgi:O-antigen/teichoic acid export membrane protein